MIEVHAREGEGIEDLLRRFKRKFQQENIGTEMRQRSFARTRSQKRRLKSAVAQKRAAKLQRMKQQRQQNQYQK